MKQELIKSVTIEDVQRAIPSRKHLVTPEIVEIINKSRTEPEFQGESLLSSMATYEKVLTGSGRSGVREYINALKFVAYLISLDDNFTEAYRKVFFDREFVKERAESPPGSVPYRELTSAASRYRRSKFVVDILTASQVPMELLFAGARYRAVQVLIDIMEDGKYDRDRINAAKEVLVATKGPENVKIALDLGVSENSAIEQLEDKLTQIAAKQKALIESKTTRLEDFGAMTVEEGEVVSEQ